MLCLNPPLLESCFSCRISFLLAFPLNRCYWMWLVLWKYVTKRPGRKVRESRWLLSVTLHLGVPLLPTSRQCFSLTVVWAQSPAGNKEATSMTFIPTETQICSWGLQGNDKIDDNWRRRNNMYIYKWDPESISQMHGSGEGESAGLTSTEKNVMFSLLFSKEMR